MTNANTANAIFSVELKVRDYECDIQGIVNNSVYQNYFEHARHEYLLNAGLSFSDLAARGVNLVVTRIEINYKGALRSGDRFTVSADASRSGKVRGQFEQAIHRLEDNKLMTTAIVEWACINAKGRPFAAPELDQLTQLEITTTAAI